MFRKSIAAAVLVAGAALVPAAAQAATGFTVERTELFAGPDYDYPTIRHIADNRRVEIFGCLNDWSFCDVGYRSERGWVNGRDIVVDYRSRRVRLVDAGPYVGIGFLSFSFGNYWDNHYRGRPFYRERGRWERHYHDHYRSSWGPRRGGHDRDRHDRDRRDHNGRDRHDNDRHDRGDRDRTDNNRHDRGDRDRTDNNRRDNDNRVIHRGTQSPAAVTPTPRPRASDRNDQRRDDVRKGDNRSPDRDRNVRNPAPTPGAAIAPTAAPRGPAAGNDRPDRNRPDRKAVERPDRPDRKDAAERRAPRETPARQRDDREPRNKRGPVDPDDENRPGR
ncbi:hypothetical protein [Emcibacter sp. SYSU 3D8]|uniref:SH3 domain-containing protein n=1 Tax=Emcibacter sp. SYSU 3D8 TaxID=3133969 RepID=UPI0031FEA188